ncbi:MAG: PQQ-dependent sugar dehydrogenase [Phycisphaerales bacterium]|nr:PQQ-dependent sugar dehydrogenase [Phycisphaerales bacterium]
MLGNRTTFGICAAMAGLGLVNVAVRAADEPGRRVPEGVWVRPGYTLSVAEATIRAPRFMAFGNDGTLYVSLPNAGEIKACRDTTGDGYLDWVTTFVQGHRSVHGLCWHEGWLWFSESGAIFRAQDRDDDGTADVTEPMIPAGRLPSGGGHWWRSLLIHGDRLYTSIGDSGNINDETDTPRQKIWTYALDGTDERLFCSGLRNTEKLVVRPGTDEIWGMDHGSDWFGGVLERRAQAGQPITDLNPPDEMNRYEQGGFYGHPFIVGKRIPRYEFMDRKDIVELAARSISPQWLTGAHWAPNAMVFYDAEQFPGVRGSAFVAYHGSWNRTDPAGYCVTRVLFEDGKPYGEQVYVRFLSAEPKVLGRPVDCVVAPDGSLLISDDGGHRIYRLRYTGTP